MVQVIKVTKQEIGGGFAPDPSLFQSISVQILAGQSSVTVTDLVNSTIILLQREIIPYTQGDTPGTRVYTFDTATGLITFNFANPTDAETLFIFAYPTPASGQEIATEPVSLGEAKTHLRVTFPDDDQEIYDMISRARQAIEDYCSISIVQKRIVAILRATNDWDLPYGPVIALENVESKSGYSGYGSFSGEYYMDGDRLEATNCSELRLTYTAGYLPCPHALKAAILNQVAFLYENRGQTSDSGVCDQAQQLANPYRVVQWI